MDEGDTAGSPPRHLKCLETFRFGPNPGHLFGQKSRVQLMLRFVDPVATTGTQSSEYPHSYFGIIIVILRPPLSLASEGINCLEIKIVAFSAFFFCFFALQPLNCYLLRLSTYLGRRERSTTFCFGDSARDRKLR